MIGTKSDGKVSEFSNVHFNDDELKQIEYYLIQEEIENPTMSQDEIDQRLSQMEKDEKEYYDQSNRKLRELGILDENNKLIL